MNNSSPLPPPGNNSGAPPPDPYSTFFAARTMSYEELCARQELEEKKMELEAEQAMLYMTDAMRQINIDRLVGVVNGEKMGPSGMSSDQALIVLQKMLAREDFSFATLLYPGLKEAVENRYAELVSKRLPGRKKE